jgi:hypothetical protein
MWAVDGGLPEPSLYREFHLACYLAIGWSKRKIYLFVTCKEELHVSHYMKNALTSLLLIFIIATAYSQDKNEKILDQYQHMADSTILARFGEDFCKKHLKFKRAYMSKSYAKNDGSKNCFYNYTLCINRKHCADIVRVLIDEKGTHAYMGTDLSDYLKKHEGQSFLSVDAIATIAKDKLNLGRGKFDVILAMEGYDYRIEYFSRIKLFKFEGLLVLKIHEPDVSERMGSHNVLTTFGKYVIVDAITGKVLEKGKKKTKDTGW